MKVGVFVDPGVKMGSGGQFNAVQRLLRAVDTRSFDPRLEVGFVGRGPASRYGFSKSYTAVAPFWLYLVFWFLRRTGIVPALSRLFSRNLDLCNHLDRRALARAGIDLLFLASQSSLPIRDVPFVTLNWDIGHKSTYPFPELSSRGSFESRRLWYEQEMQRALSILAESNAGKEELVRFLAIAPERIAVMPLFAGGVIDAQVGEAKQRDVLEQLQLRSSRFFFYPAQYWAHKNHSTLVAAFAKLASRPGNGDLRLVFTGKDKGNKAHVLTLIARQGLTERVLALDYTSNDALYTLFKHATALVMPTFLGPTNMPLLEAQALGTPVICTDLPGHREQLGVGALYVRPDSADDICGAMGALLDEGARRQLVAAAFEVAKSSPFTIAEAMRALEAELVRLIPIRAAFA